MTTRLPLLLGSFLLVCGCGDYEARMRREQERLERFDDEEKYLDQALDVQKLEGGKNAPVPEVFLRGPKNIPPQPESVPLGQGVALYRFVRPPGKDGPFQEVHVAVAPPEMMEKDFLEGVLHASSAYFRKRIDERARVRTVEDREPLTVTPFRDEPSGYQLFIGRAGTGTHFAVGYLPSGPTTPISEKALNASLDTLTFGPDAGRARLQWSRASSLRKPPK